MKKKILVSIILVIIILVGIIGYYLYKNGDIFGKKEIKKLGGEKITDGVYLYKLNIGDFNHKTVIIDNNIYYLVELEDRFEFYKIDIQTNEKDIVGVIKSKDYCYMEHEYIECAVNNKKELYDYNFKKVYDDKQQLVVPYKNGLITVVDDKIYFKNKEYRKPDFKVSDFNLYDYKDFDNNIYLFFANMDDGCIYNLEDNKCEDYKYSNIKKYSNGLYYINENTINVVNVNTKENKEYSNPVKDKYLTVSQLNDNKLYFFSNDYLRVYDLISNKVKLFDYRLNKYVDEMIYDNGLLYLITTDEVIIIKLDEIVLNEMTLDELDNVLEKKLSEKIESLKNDYGVSFKIRKDADLKFEVYKETITGETSYDMINDALDETEELFSVLGKDVFKEFIHDDYKGLNIYLASDIDSDFKKSGEQLKYYDNYVIIALSDDYKRTLCHEMLHALEDAASTKGKNIFNKWSDYNPKGFKYKGTFNDMEASYKYTIAYGEGIVYFVDNYAETNELEDRARIFENVCMNTTYNIKENPNLLKKAQYEKEELLKYYPTLKDSTIFNSLE